MASSATIHGCRVGVLLVLLVLQHVGDVVLGGIHGKTWCGLLRGGQTAQEVVYQLVGALPVALARHTAGIALALLLDLVVRLLGEMKDGGATEQGDGRISLPAEPVQKSEPTAGKQETQAEGKEIFTEIMASIYIKQGKYESAVKIIRQLSLKYPKKNRYFADQIRFLEKLVLNDKNK